MWFYDTTYIEWNNTVGASNSNDIDGIIDG